MRPGWLLGAAALTVVLAGAVTAAVDLDPGSPVGIVVGLVIIGAMAVGAVALVWLPVDLLRRRRARRDARFAELDDQPAPEPPVAWVVEALDRGPESHVRLREVDGTRTLVARVDESSDLHAPAPPTGTEVVIVSHGKDASFEFVNAAIYYERDVAPEDDWVVLAHPVDSDEPPDAGDGPAPAAAPDAAEVAGATDTSTPPPVWPTA